jgi:hypothetical protein
MRHLLNTAPLPGLRQVLFWSSQEPQIPGHDYLASRFAAAIYLRNTDLRNDFMGASALHQDDLALLQLVRAMPEGLVLLTRDPQLRERLVSEGYSAADMDRLTIDTITEPVAESSASYRSYDITPRGLLPSIFRTR